MYIPNIFKEGELPESSVVKEYLTTAADGKNYQTSFYMIPVDCSIWIDHLRADANAGKYRRQL